MKRRVRIIAAFIAIFVLCFTATVFVACNETLSPEEGRDLLVKGIEAAKESDVYYIKYRVNDNSSLNGKYVQYSLNVQKDTAKFTVATGDILKTVYDDTYYGRSLKQNVDAKNASESDYITGKVFWGESGKWEIARCSLYEFLTDGKIADYNMDSVAGLLTDLTEQELEISSVSETGKVVYITAKVTKEGNPLSAYPSLTIRLINGKLAYVGDSAENLYINISYGGPKISVPAWTAETAKE